jgi:hypothetical protein
MADVLAPTQKIDGPAPVAGPPLVDLSKLDATKPAPTNIDKAATTADSGSVLTTLQLTDNSSPAPAAAKVADTAAPAPAVQTTDGGIAPAAAKIADTQTGTVTQTDCDKSDHCSFTPEKDHDKPLAKSWWDARGQLVGTAPEKDANCLYTVKFGDDLSTIAQRQLQAEGKAVNSHSLKDEEDKLIKLNDAQYKSLDCNRHYLQAGWRLKLTDDCAAPAPASAPVEAAPAPAPAPVEAAPAPQPPPPPEKPPCDEVQGGRRGEGHIFQAPGHHIILNYNDCQYQYDVPPGKSIIYNDNGQQRMITVLNEDGSRPRHSEIIYEIDRQGRRHHLSHDQQRSFYEHFAPDYAQNLDTYRNDGAYPVQDKYSIEERRANERRRHEDEEARRLEAERIAADRHKLLLEQQATTRATTGPEISKLPTEAERTQARTEAMEKIRAQQAADKQLKIEQQKLHQQEEQQKLQEQEKLKQEQQHPRRTEAPAPAPAPAPVSEAAVVKKPAATTAASVDVP